MGGEDKGGSEFIVGLWNSDKGVVGVREDEGRLTNKGLVLSNRLGVWEGVGRIGVIDLPIESLSRVRASEPMEGDIVCRSDRSTSSMESRNERLVPRMKNALGRGLRMIRRGGESNFKRIVLLRGGQGS